MMIKDEHIKHAEEIFIGGHTFEKGQRVPFIKNLDTCDLLAVPGSGKTTALMAKLYCIAQNMPFEDGSGILVLAHTNAAIEEIEKNLKKHCPVLFQYPNYVGTIQGFIDRFLANPANMHKYGAYLNRIDSDIANENIEEYLAGIKRKDFRNRLIGYLFIQGYGQHAIINRTKLISDYKFTEEEAVACVKELRSKKIINKYGVLDYGKAKDCDTSDISDELKRLISSVHKEASNAASEEQFQRGIRYYPDFINEKLHNDVKPLGFDTDSGAALLSVIERNFVIGVARYRDCYCLANWYINTFPDVKTILQNRFKYVFVDEAQDLENFQLEIIDKIFFEEGSSTVIQRIGDINQAIYNSSNTIKIECDWKSRQIQSPDKYIDLHITGSNRLTATNARLVNCFTLDPRGGEFNVEGKRKLEDSDIRPHLVLFDENTSGEKLKEKFYEIIQKYRLESTKEAEKYGFKIIGWSSKWEDDKKPKKGDRSKLRLEDIFTDYKKDKSSKKENLDSLNKYIQFYNDEDATLNSIREAILSALVMILRLDNKKREILVRGVKRERHYTKQDLISYIKDAENGIDYDDFIVKLFQWCFDAVCKKDLSTVYKSIKQFVEAEFQAWFGLTLEQRTQEFIGSKFEDMKPPVSPINEDEGNPSDIIEICTVHSAKGQTHCATMYVETSYYTYESQKLIEVKAPKTKTREAIFKPNPLLGEAQNYSGVQKKQAVKMMYVGFSRPTHLLCFAALKDNVIADIEDFRKAKWKIVSDLVDG